MSFVELYVNFICLFTREVKRKTVFLVKSLFDSTVKSKSGYESMFRSPYLINEYQHE